MKNQKELTFAESIDKAIEVLQELKQQEDNNGAFILTATQDDPTDKASVLVSCVSTEPIMNQLNGLAQYIDTDSRIMPILEAYHQNTK